MNTFCLLWAVIGLTAWSSPIIDAMIRVSQGSGLCPGYTLPLSTAYSTATVASFTRCYMSCMKSDNCLSVSYHKTDVLCYLFSSLAADDCQGLMPDPHVKFVTKLKPFTCLNGGVVNTDGESCQCSSSFVDSRCQRLMRDCNDGAESGYYNSNDFYVLKPVTSTNTFTAYCTLAQPNKGTTIVRNGRETPISNFNKGWNEMKQGFGSLVNNYWPGLDLLHHLTTNRKYKLLVYITSAPNMNSNAPLSYYKNFFLNFHVANETSNYKLTYSSVTSSIGSSMSFANDSEFSTYDNDNDENPTDNCANLYGAPFWFKSCGDSNPLGTVRMPANLLNKPKRMYWDAAEISGDLPIDLQFMLFKQ